MIFLKLMLRMVLKNILEVLINKNLSLINQGENISVIIF